jgi:protein involved in polysaccharide export with SLBB domain
MFDVRRSTFDVKRPSPPPVRFLPSAICLLLSFLLAAPALAQEDLTNEQLIRRALELTTAPPSSNSPAPAVVAPTPAPSVEEIPVFTGNSRPARAKAPVFSEVPPDFFEPVAPASPAPAITPTNAMAALDAKHILAIGDRLSFRIVEDEEDPRALVVTDSGELEVPYLGRFAAAGKTCQELALALKTELEKEYYYRATVIIAVDLMARSRGKVYLVGPVRMPGPQEIPSDEVLTISKAVLRAGGFTDFADKKAVKITRKSTTAGGEDQTFTVNVGEILEQGRTETDLPLRPGDLIYIQERMIRF